MNYKRIFKSRASRQRILRLLSFIPDKPMIKLQYWIKTGRRVNLNNPQRFTEKIQWYKLYYKNPLMVPCVDKYDVREYVIQKGYKNILNGCLGVFESSESVDWDSLPDSYVVKNTLGGGSNSVFVVKNRDPQTIEDIQKKIQNWGKKRRKKSGGREWPYYTGKKSRILIEEYLEESSGDLVDYKFFCFDGCVKYFYVRSGYSENHDEGKMAFFDRECKYFKGVGLDYCGIASTQPNLPFNISEMIRCADDLSKDFPHVRVDLYNIDGRIVFGELTFYNASGYMKFIPDEWDLKFGREFKLRDK